MLERCYFCLLPRSSVVLATFHTITLGFMLLLSCSSSSAIAKMGSNRTDMILEAISSQVNEQYPPGEGWKIIFFVAVFLLSELLLCYLHFGAVGRALSPYLNSCRQADRDLYESLVIFFSFISLSLCFLNLKIRFTRADGQI